MYKSHPEFEAHHKIHQDLIQQTGLFVDNFKQHKLELRELLDFIYDWIVNHNTDTDSHYFKDLEKLK